MDNQTVIIFGGSGFIGMHLAKYLLENGFAEKIYSLDIVKPRYTSDKISYIACNIRNPIDIEIEQVEVIYNLAAIHQTPGHPNEEYFITNIRGAQNVCDFAEQKGIKTIVFASSISPYGASEDLKTEDSIPQPLTAYGTSKLTAEYIHRMWLERGVDRKLVIIRPGVVFGYGENGNFTRLYNSMKNCYFFYPGRKDTKKACVYVKDLVRSVYEMSCNGARLQFYNMCYPEPPAIEEITQTISEVTGIAKPRLVIPAKLLRVTAAILGLFTKKETGFHPDRIKKLMISTNISGEKLARSPYRLKYSLKEAIEDWYKDCNQIGLF